ASPRPSSGLPCPSRRRPGRGARPKRHDATTAAQPLPPRPHALPCAGSRLIPCVPGKRPPTLRALDLFGEYAPFGTMIERHCRRPRTYVNALLRGGLGGPTWSPERTGLSFCRVAGPELSRTVTSRAATSAGDHGIAQTARVRVARQPDATAAVATASRTASRVS